MVRCGMWFGPAGMGRGWGENQWGWGQSIWGGDSLLVAGRGWGQNCLPASLSNQNLAIEMLEIWEMVIGWQRASVRRSETACEVRTTGLRRYWSSWRWGQMLGFRRRRHSVFKCARTTHHELHGSALKAGPSRTSFSTVGCHLLILP